MPEAVVHCVAMMPLVCDNEDPSGRVLLRKTGWHLRWFAASERARFEEVAAAARAGALPDDRLKILSLTAEQVATLPANQRFAAQSRIQEAEA